MKKYLALLLLLTLVLSTVSCKREKESGYEGNSSQDSASDFDSHLLDNSIEEESAENSTEESQEESSEESDVNESETAPVTEGSEAPLPEESLTQENSSDSAALSVEEIQSLDGKQETWGPGKNVDDKNRPTACVQLQVYTEG